MQHLLIEPPACIGLLGGSGFVGRSLARHLNDAGYQVRILTRSERIIPDLAVLPGVQCIPLVGPDPAVALRDALRGCAAVVNLVGILHESGRQTFTEVHVGLTGRLLAAASEAGVGRFLQISALGAAADAPSRYLRSKAEAEQRVQQSGLDVTILRPSVIFGREDSFLNLFAVLVRALPVMVLASPDARFQPIHVEDVARAAVACLTRPQTIGAVLELGGPEVFTLRQLIDQVGAWLGLRRPVIGLSPGLSMLQAALLELLPVKLMTRDNVRSMQVPNVCSGPFPSELGFQPAALATVVPEYLRPERGRARYGRMRQFAGR